MDNAEYIPADILNALLSSMFTISPIAMSITSSNGRDSQYLRVNAAYLRLVGREWSELQGVKVADSAVREDEARARRHERLANEGGYVGEYVEIHRADGTIVPTLISAQRSIIGAVQYDVEIIVDISSRISEQRAHEQALSALARTDVMSGLPNRRAFDERLEQLVPKATPERRLVLALLDLDGFKAINDEHGHAAGDTVLQIVGQRLVDTLREGDFVARIGGDEFAILFAPGPRVIPEERLDQIVAAVSAPMQVAEQTLSVGLSIGVVELGAGEDASKLFRRADEAMYDMKYKRTAGVKRG